MNKNIITFFLSLILVAGIVYGGLWATKNLDKFQGYFGDKRMDEIKKSNPYYTDSNPFAKSGIKGTIPTMIIRKEGTIVEVNGSSVSINIEGTVKKYSLEHAIVEYNKNIKFASFSELKPGTNVRLIIDSGAGIEVLNYILLK